MSAGTRTRAAGTETGAQAQSHVGVFGSGSGSGRAKITNHRSLVDCFAQNPKILPKVFFTRTRAQLPSWSGRGSGARLGALSFEPREQRLRARRSFGRSSCFVQTAGRCYWAHGVLLPRLPCWIPTNPTTVGGDAITRWVYTLVIYKCVFN